MLEVEFAYEFQDALALHCCRDFAESRAVDAAGGVAELRVIGHVEGFCAEVEGAQFLQREVALNGEIGMIKARSFKEPWVRVAIDAEGFLAEQGSIGPVAVHLSGCDRQRYLRWGCSWAGHLRRCR